VASRWIPRRNDAAGLALVAALGIAAMLLTRALPRSPLVSDVLIAMLLGALVLNTPLGKLIGLGGRRDADKPSSDAPASARPPTSPILASCASGDRSTRGLPAPSSEGKPSEFISPHVASRGCDRYSGGIAFTCSGLLRLAIILMGLKVQTSALGGHDLLLVIAVCATAVPSTFFVAQILGNRLGLRQPFADLLAAGSMICGASAVNATAPIVGAQKQEQGLAVGIVFLSSVAAMLSFRAIAHAAGLPPAEAGLWAGLSVNDLSSAVAVGSQMGADGGVTAAAAKSTRILMMAPMLVALALLRRGPASPSADASAPPRRCDASLRQSIVASLPLFIVGYIAFALVRVAGDHLFAAAPAWRAVLDANRFAVELLMAMVSAGIGLSLAFGAILGSGSRGIAASVSASAFMAALTLAMVTASTRSSMSLALTIGAATVLVTYAAYSRCCGRQSRERARLAKAAAALPTLDPTRKLPEPR
jgi:uncharacterized integral membrane protein (TIGR00698 family)